MLLTPLLYLILHCFPPDVTLPESLLNRVQLHLDGIPIDHLLTAAPIILRQVAVNRRRRQTLIEWPQILLRLAPFQVG
jgi:hypothetical protein